MVAPLREPWGRGRPRMGPAPFLGFRTMRGPMRALLVVAVVAVALSGCTQPPEQPPPPPPEDGTTPSPPPPATPPSPPTTTPGRPLAFHEIARLEAPGRVAAAARGAWLGGGVALADSDNDRQLDVLLTGPDGLRLYRNTTQGARTDVTATLGLACGCRALGVAPGDLDNDDDADLLVTVEGEAPRVYRNGGARYERLADGAVPGLPADATTAGWLDVDNDGLLDLVAFRAGGEPVALENLNGTFQAFPATAWPAGLGAARAAAFVDLDADGLLDVLALGATGFKAMKNGNGTFAPFATGFNNTASGRTLAVGDIDTSATQDVVVAGDGGVAVFTNSRGRSLRPGDAITSEPAWSVALLDHDLDGDLDAVAALKDGGLKLFRKGAAAWEAVAEADSGLPATGEFRGLAVGDWDNDGRSDLVASRLDAPAVLYHNGNGQGPSKGGFFKVVPSGVQTNRDGIGARVIATGANLQLERYVLPGLAGMSTSAPEVVFGLGQVGLTNLRIQWPSGTLQDQSIPAENNKDRILLASEEASRSEWGDNSC